RRHLRDVDPAIVGRPETASRGESGGECVAFGAPSERRAAAGEAGAAELSRPRFWPSSPLPHAVPATSSRSGTLCRAGSAGRGRTAAQLIESHSRVPSRPETKSRVGYTPSTTTHDTPPAPPTFSATPTPHSS